jgi:hypothetical protein
MATGGGALYRSVPGEGQIRWEEMKSIERVKARAKAWAGGFIEG